MRFCVTYDDFMAVFDIVLMNKSVVIDPLYLAKNGMTLLQNREQERFKTGSRNVSKQGISNWYNLELIYEKECREALYAYLPRLIEKNIENKLPYIGVLKNSALYSLLEALHSENYSS